MLTSLTIRTKIVFGQAILTILLLILSVISYQTLATLQHNTDIFASHLLKAQGVVLNADRDLYQALTAQHEYLQLTSSPTFALRVSGGGFPLLGDSCSRSTGFLLHRAA